MRIRREISPQTTRSKSEIDPQKWGKTNTAFDHIRQRQYTGTQKRHINNSIKRLHWRIARSSWSPRFDQKETHPHIIPSSVALLTLASQTHLSCPHHQLARIHLSCGSLRTPVFCLCFEFQCVMKVSSLNVFKLRVSVDAHALFSLKLHHAHEHVYTSFFGGS